MRYSILLLIMVMFIGMAGAAQDEEGDVITGNTLAIVNLRGGPGTSFDKLVTLAEQLPLEFIGRNADNTWLFVRAEGVEGWLLYRYANVEGSVWDLPIVDEIRQAPPPTDAPVAPEATVPPTESPNGEISEEGANPERGAEAVPAPQAASTDIAPPIPARAREIFLHGQELGNRADVFSKVGDSITASDFFLDHIGHGGAVLYDHAYLQPVIDHFSQTPARDHYSFANTSLAARSGWNTIDVLDPSKNRAGLCGVDETPLACEYRVSRPAVALIMFGTNDVGSVDGNDYRYNLTQIVEISIDMGVIPVLSTIPDQIDTFGAPRIDNFNAIIRSVAAEYSVPLWDYWAALQPLPNRGLGSDGIHPSYDITYQETAIFSPGGLTFGYNMRNLTALMVLDAVWRSAMQ
jgi:uncharacterized protein YraI